MQEETIETCAFLIFAVVWIMLAGCKPQIDFYDLDRETKSAISDVMNQYVTLSENPDPQGEPNFNFNIEDALDQVDYDGIISEEESIEDGLEPISLQIAFEVMKAVINSETSAKIGSSAASATLIPPNSTNVDYDPEIRKYTSSEKTTKTYELETSGSFEATGEWRYEWFKCWDEELVGGEVLK